MQNKNELLESDSTPKKRIIIIKKISGASCPQNLFSPEKETKNEAVAHIVIPTSVNHHYENKEFGAVIRNALYIKKYDPIGLEQNPIVFFHGGPNIVNEEQFSIMQDYFTKRGHAFYIPEIEGSGMYSNGAKLPNGFEPKMIPQGLNLLDLNKYKQSGLNEFIQNYVDDVKDILNEVSKRHPGKKINVIMHSLGSHQVLRTLQYATELKDKIESICNIAGTSDMGATRFWATLNQLNSMGVCDKDMFDTLLEEQSKRFLKSSANENQSGSAIDKINNPSIDQQMNESFSVLYGDLSSFPPMLLVHATDDQSVFFQGSLLLQEKIQKNGGIAQGLYFETGGHQFIKNEGNPEIRTKALEKMNEFFQQPTNKISKDLSQLQYEDVISEHKLFLQDKDSYLNDKFGPKSMPF